MTTLDQFGLSDLQTRLSEDNVQDESLQRSAEHLKDLARQWQQQSQPVLAKGAEVLAQLTELAATAGLDGSDHDPMRGELIAFVSEHVCSLAKTSADETLSENNMISQFVADAESKWNEYLLCLDSLDSDPNDLADGWDESVLQSEIEYIDETAEPSKDELRSDPQGQIELLLSAIAQQESESPDDSFASNEPPATESSSAEDADSAIEDDDMREAFLDDATRCLNEMEKCSLSAEQNPGDNAPVIQFCRELHTLKGASASVGLGQLASFIHEIESSLQEQSGKVTENTVEALLDTVDRVRIVVAQVSAGKSKDVDKTSANTPNSNVRVAPISLSNHATGDDALIRIRTSKLNRLMDMLAELVVLRNRRESHIAEFSEFNEELSRCALRLSVCQNSTESSMEYANGASGSNTLHEIVKDIAVVSNSIRDLQKPVTDDNLAISHFIRDFRQELMQLRRVPTEGLFNRLQRAARDVAKVEAKQLQIVCVGGQSGLEQELQEKLYEPLLHIIRNAVSHGIEPADVRVRSGKTPVGTVTLKAQSNSQLLVMEVKDDGNGLDYDAIRRRAMDKGLITGSRLLSDQELGQLIFHPGFSTRDEATQISGRGVGMDVVASTLDQMRGRIEIDSVPGEGTTMRLVVPLRSAIEHVMVFRSSGQLFALPTHSVSSARKSRVDGNNMSIFSLASMLSLPEQGDPDEKNILLLRDTGQVTATQSKSRNSKEAVENEQIGLEVQEIVGPEEVVVRNLPGPLACHPLFCGLTLSGAGETVLLLDNSKLLEYVGEYKSVAEYLTKTESTIDSKTKKQILVVDDSLSSRKSLAKKLSRLGFTTTEAGDGIEALDILRHREFDLVMTDLDMPRLGGLEMLCDLQQRGQNKTPVIVVSGRNEDEFRQQAVDYGAADYLTKPVENMSLKRALSNLEFTLNEVPSEGS